MAKTKLILPNIKYLHNLCKYFSTMTPNLFYDAQHLSQHTGLETTFYIKVNANNFQLFLLFQQVSSARCYNLNRSIFHVIKNKNALCFTFSICKTTASHAQNHDKQNNKIRNLTSKCSNQHKRNKQNIET